MSIAEGLLPEFDMETNATRPFLERFPEGRNDWKPAEKSYTLQQLASHVVGLIGWAPPTLQQDELDLAPPGGKPLEAFSAMNREELLSGFDQIVAETRAALAGTPDEAWDGIWTLKSGGEAIMGMPRSAVYRTFIISHLAHHRAQLGVYYRLLGIPVPQTYGPTADEG